MTDIGNRSDIDLVLRAFYGQALHDPLLRRIFVEVAHMDLEEHLPIIGDFWEKVLFNTTVYNGRAMEVHRRLHRREPFTAAHFDRWLVLWDRTVDAQFAGPVADRAKGDAARIAVAIQRNLPPAGAPPQPAELPLLPHDNGAARAS